MFAEKQGGFMARTHRVISANARHRMLAGNAAKYLHLENGA